MKYRVIIGLLAVVLAGLVVVEAGAQSSDRVPAFPLVNGHQVLKCDFHMHTPHSDGDIAPVARVEEAAEQGYDAIAITDHGNFKAYAEALPRANELGLVLVRGMETGLADREHLVALGFDAAYEPVNPHKWARTEDEDRVFYQTQWRRLVEEAGAFVLYAHPHKGFEEPVQWAVEEDLLKGIEVKNGVVGEGWNTVESHGTWFYPFALDWAIEHDLAVFANSDAHDPRDADNLPITLVLVDERSAEGVLEALHDGRTIAWFDGMLWGKQDLLRAFIEANIDVSPGDTIDIHNRGSVPLTGVFQDGHSADVPPFKKASVTRENAGDTMTITWANVWVRPDKNLATTHSLQ
ncbi:MAG: CehA/McbA family metallohydrolase [Candidatus Hydrogenedentota bacterium]